MQGVIDRRDIDDGEKSVVVGVFIMSMCVCSTATLMRATSRLSPLDSVLEGLL